MELFLQWLRENFGTILTSTGLLGLSTYLVLYFKAKIFPKIMEKIILMFAKLVSNMFGISFGEGEDMVEALPFVQNFQTYINDTKVSNELKLLELANKLSSPLYTTLERAPIQAAYNYLYNKMKDDLSPEIRDALDAIEKLKATE